MGQRVKVAASALSAEDVLQGTFGVKGHFNTIVHPSDQMLTFVASVLGNEETSRFHYFRAGAQLMDVVQQLVEWKFGGMDRVEAFLDFASGFGRLTRFLVQQLPAERLWVSDIQAEAIEYQREQFGVHGFVSETDPDDLKVAEKFDCIFVASLFSHLPEKTFVPWLRKLYGMLKPDGMLVFSVHDESLLDGGTKMPKSGLFYREASEIAELDTRDYGTTFVTEGFVGRAVEQASGGRGAYHRIRKVMYYQDLYVLLNKEYADFSRLRFEYGPGGAVDYCYWSQPGELCVGGWTVDVTQGSAIEEIAVYVNGKMRQKCLPFRRRADVRAHFNDDAFLYSGWECFCRVPGRGDGDLLTAVVRTTGGTEYLLYVGSIGGVLTPERAGSNASVIDPAYVDQLEGSLGSLKAEFVGLEGYVRRLEGELEAARAPRLFWKKRG